MLPTHRLEYDLPDALIATHPARPRDASRLMVLSRSDPDRLEHRRFTDLPEYLNQHDVMVRNKSAVLPARLTGRRTDSGGRIEGLFLDALDARAWRVMLRSNGKLREGQRIALHHPDHPDADTVEITITARTDQGWQVQREDTDPRDTNAVLSAIGATPLPPYILSARRHADDHTADTLDRADYQTIYADTQDAQSVAAPTAGLHFTPDLERKLDEIGVRRAEVLLHVGAGTFAPVNTDTVEEHPIHSEWVSVPPDTTQAIDASRSAGGRAVVVGTTSVRALESVPPDAVAFTGPTDLLLTPGSTFHRTDALITNFHLPRSTLLALVAALFDQEQDPVRRLLDAYEVAIRERYRFYSFGDAMLILP